MGRAGHHKKEGLRKDGKHTFFLTVYYTWCIAGRVFLSKSTRTEADISVYLPQNWGSLGPHILSIFAKFLPFLKIFYAFTNESLFCPAAGNRKKSEIEILPLQVKVSIKNSLKHCNFQRKSPFSRRRSQRFSK